MRIVVCVKQVLNPHGLSVNRKAEKVFVNREEYLIDPASKAALEVAESIKGAGDEVIAISIGGLRVDEALREATARGADRSILIRSDAPLDAFVVANMLAAAVEKVGNVDLVLCGDRSLDTACGEVAPRIAAALNRPSILNAVKVEIIDQTLSAIVHEADFFKAESQLPAVVSIIREAFTGKYANAWRLIDAYKKSVIEIWNANDLGLDEDDLRPRSIKKEDAFPPERQLGTQVKNAKELVAMLKRERIVL